MLQIRVSDDWVLFILRSPFRHLKCFMWVTHTAMVIRLSNGIYWHISEHEQRATAHLQKHTHTFANRFMYEWMWWTTFQSAPVSIPHFVNRASLAAKWHFNLRAITVVTVYLFIYLFLSLIYGSHECDCHTVPFNSQPKINNNKVCPKYTKR